MFKDTPIGILASKVSSLKDNEIWMLSANNRLIKKLIIELNTKVQLFNDNTDSKGVRLNTIGGNYSPVTLIASKTSKKSLQDINLKDTGDFYKSFKVTITTKGIVIDADTDKGDNDLTDRWGDDIIGLTQENLGVVSEKIKDRYITILRRKIGI